MNDYVNLLMQEWRLDKQPAKFRREVEKVLMELGCEAQLRLRNEPRLQVEVMEDAPYNVWAYFPMHRRRWIAKGVKIRPTTRVLLILDRRMFERKRRTIHDLVTGKKLDATDCLRDHLGHVLLYLRKPKARNECSDALREWKESCSHNGAQSKGTTLREKVRKVKF